MENKTQNQPNNDSNTKGEKFDVFISYRYISTKDNNKNPDHKHITSLARSIDQALSLEGFNVFFDCRKGFENFLSAIDDSRYFVILFTNDSIAAIEKFPYETIKEMVAEGRSGEEGEGNNFARELFEIENRIKSKSIKKDHIFLLDIDERYTSGINKTLSNCHYHKLATIGRTPFPTNKTFSINELINPNNENEKRIRKKIQCFKREIPGIRLSYERCKRLSRLFLFSFALLVCAVIMLFLLTREKMIFAGGGTVQQYLIKTDNKEINKFGSIYIHIPSTTAWQLLWDDVNEGWPRRYCPVVLSTGEIDTTDANVEELKKERRIIEYNVDSIPLMVQLFENQKRNCPITLDSLKIRLQDTMRYEIWTTTEKSGTYLKYKELLKDTVSKFNLDALVNNQKGGRKDFNLKKADIDENKTPIFLANKYYYYQPNEKNRSDRILVSDTIMKDTLNIPLYVYTIASKENEGDNFELLPQVKNFLDHIGCNTDEKIGTITHKRLVVTLKKRTKTKKHLLNLN